MELMELPGLFGGETRRLAEALRRWHAATPPYAGPLTRHPGGAVSAGVVRLTPAGRRRARSLQRTASALRLRREGMTYRELAAAMGLSRTRAAQIVAAAYRHEALTYRPAWMEPCARRRSPATT